MNNQIRGFEVVNGRCAGSAVCPLSRAKVGSTVCIKGLAAAPEMRDRLRELGLVEEQRVKLLSAQSTVICLVCNARLALSENLAQAILVEPVPTAA